MIVTMRNDIKPLCDKHTATAMRLVRLESGTLSVKAFACAVPECTHCYNGSLGYFYDTKDGFLAEKFQQNCPEDGNPMFLESVIGETENWRCAQLGCNHTQQFVAKMPYL